MLGTIQASLAVPWALVYEKRAPNQAGHASPPGSREHLEEGELHIHPYLFGLRRGEGRACIGSA
jgi:hypothetical protein